MHCSLRLILQTPVFSRSYLHRQVSPPETLAVKGGTTWARNGRQFRPKAATSTHTLSGPFTCRKYATWDKRLFFPSEGRRGEIFSPWKIRLLRPGLNPRTWVPKASTLPLDHRSHLTFYIRSTQWRPILINGISQCEIRVNVNHFLCPLLVNCYMLVNL